MARRTSTTHRTRLATGLTGGALALTLLLTGCQTVTPSASADETERSEPSVTTPAAPPAEVEVSPADGTTRVRPDADVAVTASGGRLTAVRVTDEDGHDLDGDLASDGSGWKLTDALDLSTTYTVTATAENAEGRTSTTTSTLTTLTPAKKASYALLPSQGQVVGVGMPAVVQFEGLVSKAHRAEVEKAVTIETSPKVEGSWGWLDARQLMWRPADYWKPGTKVTVTADLAGVETADGKWATKDQQATWTVGRSMVSTVNVATHQMVVRRGGAVLRTIPITTGKKGFETRNGTKVIISRETERQMDAETTGLKKTDPDYYNVKVKYAMRLTWSGEFLHAAPWSVASQGHANVSHGCTGMSDANAKWLFDQSRMGDVVTYVGSKRALEEYNGYTVWNFTQAQWHSRSALA